ncbi:MAG: helix-turn-helix domain-containing protein [Gemmatimonadota bacterium]|nr:helix-turn-helix domain-containing protein [Gemmatimonadota bacterium]
MDSIITAAARALAAGDPLGALKRVALRNDAPALALRGIAMAQLGEFVRAKALVRSAARAFGAKEPVSRARCVVAEAEIALVLRELGWPVKTLAAARETLESHGDHVNAAHARYLEIRRLILIGRLDEADALLRELKPLLLPPASRAAHELCVAGIAIRRLQMRIARAALYRAEIAARAAGIPALSAEVESAATVLDTPAARLVTNGAERLLLLDDVEMLFASARLIVDACRGEARDGGAVISLATRPVLFDILRVLGDAWPHDVARDVIAARVFGAKVADDSHRARLRVEVGRLRKLLAPIAGITATKDGFVLMPSRSPEVVVLARPVDEPNGSLLALLADGESWSSSSLALALDASQRTVQRALDALAAAGKVNSFGLGRSRRWVMPSVPGFTTTLLLPAPLPND